MRDDFLPFCRPVISEDEISAVGEVLRSGWITTGPNTTRLEGRFCEYVGAAGAVEMGPIRALADRHGVAVIEDAAHAVGTRTSEGLVGGTGTAIFSFHPIKTMTTGEGGMICSDDADFLAATRRLRFHGLGSDAWERTSQGRVPQAEVLEPGYKYNLTDVAAVLGLSQLERLETFIGLRQELVDVYRQRLPEIEAILPVTDPAGTIRHSRSLYVVRLDSDAAAGMDRDQVMVRLKERNIGTGLHFRAVHEHAYYRKNPDLWRGDLPNTEWNSQRMFSLPLFPGMSSLDVHQVVDELKGVIAS